MAWLSGWAAEQRIELVIDNTKIDGALTNFPVMVKLSSSSGIDSSDISQVFDELASDANRLKIAVTEDDEVTECKVEIEHWDDASELAILHVKVPAVASGADTTLYLYYDSAHADNTTNVGDIGDAPAQAVWDSDFDRVLHMYDGTTLKNSADGTTETLAGSLTLVDGPNGNKALQANADGDYIDCASYAFTSLFTVEAQFYIDTGGPDPGYDQLFGFNHKITLMVDHTNGTTKWGLYTGNGSSWDALVPANTLLGESTWYNIALTYNAGTHGCFLNGADDGGGSGTNRTITTPFHVFRRENAASGDYRLHGKISEFRISTVERSDAWVKATYHSLFDSLITLTDEYPPEGSGTIPIVMHHYTKNIGA